MTHVEHRAHYIVNMRRDEIERNPSKWVAEFESGAQEHGRVSMLAFNYVTFKTHEFNSLVFAEAANIVRERYMPEVAQ